MAPRRATKKAMKQVSVNGHTVPTEKLSHDTLDVLAAAMCRFKEVTGCIPGLMKVREPLRGMCSNIMQQL